MRKAAFLDRDGVINADHGYVHRAEQFDLLSGVPAALRRLRQAGYMLIVVTNQSGIARGMYTQAQYASVTQHMRAVLASEGVWLDAVYHCSHLPDAAVPRFRQHCDCRKPGPGMLRRASIDFGIDLSRSLLFGDRPSDIQAARTAPVGWCCLIAAGSANGAGADAVAADLTQGVNVALAWRNNGAQLSAPITSACRALDLRAASRCSHAMKQESSDPCDSMTAAE